MSTEEGQLHYFARELPDKYLVRNGDLLFAWSGTPGTSFGAHVWSGPEAWLNQHIFNVRFDERFIDKRFLRLAINQNLADYVKAAHGGAGLAHITKGVFERSQLLIPPLQEQRRIVAEIETQFTRLDAAVAALKRARANLKRYRAAVLSDAIQGRLTPSNDLGNQDKAHSVTGSSPFPVPIGWTWRVAKDVCQSIENGNTPPADQMNSSGEIPFIKVYNLTRFGRIDFNVKSTFVSRETHERRLRRSVIRPGDVLMNIVGPPLGKVGLVPDDYPEWNTNQAVVIFRPGPDLMAEFLCFALLAEPVLEPITKQARATAGQFNISLSMCRNAMLPIPPLEEQERIITLLRERLSLLDNLELTIEAGLKRAERLRQSILRKAFAGDLVLQDSNDEPASDLLERIKTNRGKNLQSESTPRNRRRSAQLRLV